MEFCGTALRSSREFAIDILFHHKCSDRYTVISTETTAFYIHSDGYLWVVHRSEAHKDGVVLPPVLRCSRLSAYEVVSAVGSAARTFDDRGAHSCHYPVVSPAVCLGVMPACKGSIERFALYFLYYMWRDIISSVGYCSPEIGNLQGCKVYLTLPDTDGYDGESVP